MRLGYERKINQVQLFIRFILLRYLTLNVVKNDQLMKVLAMKSPIHRKKTGFLHRIQDNAPLYSECPWLLQTDFRITLTNKYWPTNLNKIFMLLFAKFIAENIECSQSRHVFSC
jgi:hypothetical protein